MHDSAWFFVNGKSENLEVCWSLCCICWFLRFDLVGVLLIGEQEQKCGGKWMRILKFFKPLKWESGGLQEPQDLIWSCQLAVLCDWLAWWQDWLLFLIISEPLTSQSRKKLMRRGRMSSDLLPHHPQAPWKAAELGSTNVHQFTTSS